MLFVFGVVVFGVVVFGVVVFGVVVFGVVCVLCVGWRECVGRAAMRPNSFLFLD